MSDNSEEEEFLPDNPVCSECEKLKKEFDFTTIRVLQGSEITSFWRAETLDQEEIHSPRH